MHVSLHCFLGGELFLSNVSTIISKMNIFLRKDGRYEGRITVGHKRKGFYGNTKSEVKNKAKEYLLKIENGYVEPKKIILNDYIEYWLRTYKLNKIEQSSYARLCSVYEHQIKYTIGFKKIGEITCSDIQKMIDEYANPKSKNVHPLSKSGLKKIIHLLRPCMNMAVRDGVIQNNPCDGIVLPKESCILIETKEQFSLEENEIENFKKTALTRYKTTNEFCSRDWLVLLLLLSSGLRVGEILALEWNDIDTHNRILRINKTIQSNVRQCDGSYCDILKKSTKTKSGIRFIPLNDQIIEYISYLKEYDERNKIISDYVASTHVGTRNTARNLKRSLDRLIKKSEIKRNVSLHTLRHTFGSTLIRKGVGIEVVSELMGHSNITITYNKYIHTIKEEKAKAMSMIAI